MLGACLEAVRGKRLRSFPAGPPRSPRHLVAAASCNARRWGLGLLYPGDPGHAVQDDSGALFLLIDGDAGIHRGLRRKKPSRSCKGYADCSRKEASWTKVAAVEARGDSFSERRRHRPQCSGRRDPGARSIDPARRLRRDGLDWCGQEKYLCLAAVEMSRGGMTRFAVDGLAKTGSEALAPRSAPRGRARSYAASAWVDQLPDDVRTALRRPRRRRADELPPGGPAVRAKPPRERVRSCPGPGPTRFPARLPEDCIAGLILSRFSSRR